MESTTPSAAGVPRGRETHQARTLHGLIAEQVAHTPDAVAVEDETDSLTYHRLWAGSERLAAGLVGMGVEPGDVVAVVMPRSTRVITTVLAVLRAGAAYLALDRDQPAARMRGMLEDAQAKIVVVDDGDDLPAAPAGSQIVPFTELDRVAPSPISLPDVPEQAAAYAVFTSGSTGRPKGVLNEHGAIVDKIRWLADRLPLNTHDVALHKTAYVFDYSVCEVFWTLACGARLRVVPSEAQADPVRLVREMHRSGVTVAQFVPSMLAVLMEEPGFHALDRLRILVVGGEALPEELLAGLRTWSPAQVVNLYGPAECSVFATCWIHGPEDVVDGISIGTPVAGTRIDIRDETGCPVGAGETGELWIGGLGVSRGYLDRPELTRRAFIPDPARPGARWYRTGDLVRRGPDGALEYHGRLDDQVKVRGQRIEPAEVRQQLLETLYVQQAAVLPVRDAVGGVRLAAFLVDPAGELPGVREIRARLDERLPAGMMPSWIKVIGQLPIASSGKLDRAALLALLEARESAAPDNPSGDSIEDFVLRLWREFLEDGGTGPDDDFFAGGGDSLIAARMLVRIRDGLGVELRIGDLLSEPTVRGMTEQIRTRGRPADELRRPAGDTAPLSPAQRRLWLAEQLEPGHVDYNVVDAWTLSGPLDTPALEAAVRDVMTQHDALRITIHDTDGGPVQRVHPLPLAGLETLPRPLGADAARETVRRVARTHFRIGSGPLVRCVLVPLGTDRHQLVLAAHHVIMDGWSAEILWADLSRCYATRRNGDEPDPRPPALSFAEHSRRSAARPVSTEQRAYWKQTLKDLPAPLRLPMGSPSGVPRIERSVRTLDQATVARIKRLAREAHTTPVAVLLACFATLLGRWSGTTDLLIGAPLSGRTEADVHNTMGFFNATVPLRLAVGDGATPGERVGRAHRALMDAQMNQDVAFDDIVALSTATTQGRGPLFSVWFNALSYPQRGLRLDGVRTERDVAPLPSLPFDLSLYVGSRDGQVDLDLAFDAARLPAPWAAELLEQLVETVADWVGTPKVGPPSPAPREIPRPADPSPVQAHGSLLLDRVFGHPQESVAVVDEQGACTYGELTKRVETMAMKLTREGLSPGQLVEIRESHGRNLPAAILAVWRAGGVCLPTDPEAPAAWQDSLSAAARPHWLLKCDAQGPSVRPVDLGAPLPKERIAAPAPTRGVPWYVLPTSGSTGRPRLVLGTDAPLVAFLDWWSTRFGITSQDRFSVLSGRSHDPLLRDLFLPLWNGGTAVVPGVETRLDGDRLVRWLVSNEVTVLHATPMVGTLIAGAAEAAGIPMPSVRLSCFGGDVLTRAVAEAWHRVAPRSRTVVVYGTTETPQAASLYEPHAADGAETPLGAGAGAAHLVVVDPDGRPLPVGCIGEIAVRSPLLTLGYLGEPHATERSYRPDPWGDPACGLFRTGDVGRLRWDGSVLFVARSEAIVKVRGNRVSPAQLTASIRELPGVAQALVQAEESSGTTRLVAYVMPEPGTSLSGDDVMTALAHRLPAGHLPEDIRMVREFHLTPNGKLDPRGAGTPPAAPRPAAPLQDVRGRTELEQELRRLWCRVLDRPVLGIDDNFFDLGGSSLIAVRLQALVRAELGIDASPLLIFERSTVRRMAQVLAPDSDAAEARSAAPLGTPVGDARSRRKAARVGIDALSRRVRPS
ncbi:non-ribosomal peptide synthetase [Streptomyces sp. CoT10]|uniref:non-ribosomal peptide synthetase n=1 Tax=Streptomyces sp. CoT10 TaxID=2875762 RepID=UPI001CD58F6F|nr:non-ribosomal peptide synthetase [Streptomyces sp. CoT10]